MRKFSLAVTILTLGAVVCAPANAVNVGLSVTPLATEMHVAPGSSDVTSVDITNTSDAPERVTIEPIDWSTRIDGSLSYERPGTEADHSLTAYLRPVAYRFIIDAHETRQIAVALSMPASLAGKTVSFWGGLLIRAVPPDGSLALGPGATLFVYDDVGAPRRHLSIRSIRVKSGGAARDLTLEVHLKNDGTAYARTGGTLTILREGKRVSTVHVPVGAIFPGRDRIIEQSVTGLPAGSYTGEVTFDYGGDTLAGADVDLRVP